MKDFTATLTNGYAIRGNAKDARTGEPIAHRDAYRVFLPQTNDKPRYFLPEMWLERVTPEKAAETRVGKTNHNRLRYQVIADVAEDDALHAALIGRNGSQPVWFATANGYCSPSYANANWHKRLNLFEKRCSKGNIQVLITTETGYVLDTIALRWGNRDELGRFIRKDEQGKSKLLRLIDEATAKYKGYSNYR